MADETSGQEPDDSEPSPERQAAPANNDNRWGDPITPERAGELRALANRQREWAAQPEATRGDSVFEGVKLTGADVFWLAGYALAGPKANVDRVTAKQRELMNPNIFPGMVEFPTEYLDMSHLCLQGADLHEAQLQRAYLAKAQMQRVIMWGAQLEFAYLDGAQMQGVSLKAANLNGAFLSHAQLQDGYLFAAQLEHANLSYAQLQDTCLALAQLSGAILASADAQGAYLENADLRGACLRNAHLQGADLTAARMNVDTALGNVAIDSHTCLGDIVWNDAPLIQVDWQQAPRLGDETVAWQERDAGGIPKDAEMRRDEFAVAVRANRVLAVTLRAQGMNEDADRYAYRAQVLQNEVFRRQKQWWPWLFWGLLWLISGYGYRLWRILAAYGTVVLAFALFYFLVGLVLLPHLTWYNALLASFTAIHGRLGVNALFVGPGPAIHSSWQEWGAAVEGVFGIVIEGVFIAMLVQRFFAR